MAGKSYPTFSIYRGHDFYFFIIFTHNTQHIILTVLFYKYFQPVTIAGNGAFFRFPA